MFVRHRRLLCCALGAGALVISACGPLEHGEDVIEPGGDGDGEGDYAPAGDGDGDWHGASWEPRGELAYEPAPDLTCPPVEVDPTLRGSACANAFDISGNAALPSIEVEAFVSRIGTSCGTCTGNDDQTSCL